MRVWVEAWPYLLGLALLLFLPDVAIRRLQLRGWFGRTPAGPRGPSPKVTEPSAAPAARFGARMRRR
jgi:hypothetical protein